MNPTNFNKTCRKAGTPKNKKSHKNNDPSAGRTSPTARKYKDVCDQIDDLKVLKKDLFEALVEENRRLKNERNLSRFRTHSQGGFGLPSLLSTILGHNTQSKIEDILEKFSDVNIEELNDSITKLNSATDKGDEFFKLLNGTVTEINDDIKIAGTRTRQFTHFTALFIFAALAISVYHTPSKFDSHKYPLIICGVGAVLSLDVDDYKHVIKVVVDTLTNFFAKDQTRSEGLYSPIKHILNMLVALLVGKNAFDKSWSITDFTEKFIFNLDKKMESFTSVFSSLISFVNDVANYILKKTGHGSLFFFDQFFDFQTSEVLKGYKAIQQKIEKGNFLCNSENLTLLKKTIEELEQALRKIPRKSENNGELHILTTAYNSLLLYARTFGKSNFELQGLRQEPVGVLLSGAPGVGKSQTVTALYHALMNQRCVLDDDAYEVYRKDPGYHLFIRSGAEHWDGYHKDKIVTIFDDLGQVRDVAGSGESEYAQIIRCINEFPFRPPMAKLEDKADTYFVSKFVIATTNLTQFNPESIVSVGALKRRFHLNVRQIVAPRYATKDGKIDPNRLPKENGVTICNPDMFQYMDVDDDGQPSSTVYDFKTLVKKVVELYRTKFKRYELKISEMNKYYETFRCTTLEGRRKMRFMQFVKDIFVGTTSKDRIGFYMARFDQDRIKVYLRFMKRVSDVVEEHSEPGIILTPSDIDKILSASGCGHYLDLIACDPSQFVQEVEEDMLSGVLFFMTRDPVDTQMNFNDVLFKMRNFVVQHMKVLTGILGTCLVGAIAWFINDRLTKKKSDETPNPESISAARMTSKGKRVFSKPQTGQTVLEGQYYDMNGRQISNKIKINQYLLYLEEDAGEMGLVGIVTFVKERVYMMPRHFKYLFELFIREGLEERRVEFKKFVASPVQIEREMKDRGIGIQELQRKRPELFTEPVIFTVKVRDMIQSFLDYDVEGCDVTFGQLPAHFCNMHANIIKFFYKERTTPRYPTAVRLCVPDSKGTDTEYLSTGYPDTMNRDPQEWIPGVQRFKLFSKYNFKYQAMTEYGDCGSLLYHEASKDPCARIIGMHVAGTVEYGRHEQEKYGISVIVTQDMILEAIGNRQLVHEEIQEEPVYVETFSHGRFKELFKSKHKQSNNGKSEIVKSDLYGEWGTASTKPAHLRPFYIDGIRINPMETAVAKFVTHSIYIDMEAVGKVRDSYYGFLRDNSTVFVPEIYTFEVSVLGLNGDPCFKSISRGTSPGYPFKFEIHPGYVGKEWWFGKDQEYDLTRPQAKILRERVYDIINKARQNERLTHIFVDCLKDERKEVSKVDQGKTRMFSSGPMDLLIAYRMYFGAFQRWFMANMIRNGSGLGINVYSYDWMTLAKHLMQHGDAEEECFGAGDYSSFDGSEKPAIHWAILDVINRFYNDGEENQRVRNILWLELVNSKHLNGDLVYEWTASLPSGHAMTTFVNIMYNHFAFRLCWLEVGFPLDGVDGFDNNVYLCAFGDDNIFSVSRNFRDNFNEGVLPELMSKFGLRYTSEDKVTQRTGSRKLCDTSFLKRTFLWLEEVGYFCAPLELAVILEIPYWTKDDPELMLDIVYDNVKNSIEELSLHGKDVFERYAPMMADKYYYFYDTVALNKKRFDLDYYPNLMRVTKRMVQF